ATPSRTGNTSRGGMPNRSRTSAEARGRFWFAFALLLVAMAVAHGAAELAPRLSAHRPGAPAPHTVLYFRVIFSIWVTLLFLTPALCFHVFARREEPNSYWRAFWTCAYLAFLVHLYWTVAATFHFDWNEMFHSQEGVATDPERVVQHPGPDLFLAAWWGLDVLLAWFAGDRKWIRVQRGALTLLVFVMFFAAFT